MIEVSDLEADDCGDDSPGVPFGADFMVFACTFEANLVHSIPGINGTDVGFNCAHYLSNASWGVIDLCNVIG